MATSKARAATRPLTADSRIEAAIGLLAALANAPGQRLRASAARRALALSEPQLDEIIELLQLLSDSRTGSRPIIVRSGDEIALEGTAAEMDPLRLTAEEAIAVMQVLARCRLDEGVRERVAKALMPGGEPVDDAAAAASGDALFGGFYQKVVEAIQDGIRCLISYRSGSEAQATARTVDPGFIEVSDDGAYLIGWDVRKDGQRRYRLDRIAAVRFTEDSAGRHAFRRTAPAESLRAGGAEALLSFPGRAEAEALGWAGLDLDRGAAQPDGTFTAPVSYATGSWLFDQLLAAAGSIRIIGPEDLRRRFTAYARGLLDG